VINVDDHHTLRVIAARRDRLELDLDIDANDVREARDPSTSTSALLQRMELKEAEFVGPWYWCMVLLHHWI